MAVGILEGGTATRSSTAPRRLVPPILLLAFLVGVGSAAQAQDAEDVPEPGAGVSFSGRVVEKEGGKPVAGAAVVVSRTLDWSVGKDLPSWVGDTTLRTDGDGRFTIAFPAEQVAEPGLLVTVRRVTHPDFVPREGWPVPLRTMLKGRRFGDKPFFDTIALGRGIEFSGQVVTPEGRPAADVPFEFGSGSWSSDSRHFSDVTEGRTDADGRFRLRMVRTHWLTVKLIPESYAPYQTFWGTAEPAKNPDVWAPSDLGRLVLEQGSTLSGRMLDLKGRPIAGQRIVAYGRRNSVRRTATTQADGSFTFAPLRPGNYEVFGEHQYSGAFDAKDPAMPAMEPVLRPALVFWKPGGAPPALELHELPSVTVEVRFVDARGRPARGGFVRLSGGIPRDVKTGVPSGSSFGFFSLETINDPEVEEGAEFLNWSCRLPPDASGRVVFRVPKGLVESSLEAFPADETIAYKTQLAEGAPLKSWGGGRLGTLDSDRKGIRIIAYRAPTVVATIATEGGEPVSAGATVEVGYNVKGFAFGENVVRQADGRFRTQSLMPEHEYEFDAWNVSKGYFPKRVERVNLPEGGTAELTLVLRKRPALPEAGDPAPPFSVVALDGRRLSLDGFRGKFVLLHFWSPFHREDRDLPGLRALHDRYGGDGQLAMLGLCLAVDLEAASKVVKERRLTWAQAFLPDRGLDPIGMDYLANAAPIPCTYLINQDGTIVATGLSVADAEKWLTTILGPR